LNSLTDLLPSKVWVDRWQLVLLGDLLPGDWLIQRQEARRIGIIAFNTWNMSAGNDDRFKR
jgi:hypothetical protein